MVHTGHSSLRTFKFSLNPQGLGIFVTFSLPTIYHILDFSEDNKLPTTGAEVLSLLNQARQIRKSLLRIETWGKCWKQLEKINLRAQPVQTFLLPRLHEPAWFLSAPHLMIGPSLQSCVFTLTLPENPFCCKLVRIGMCRLQMKSPEGT